MCRDFGAGAGPPWQAAGPVLIKWEFTLVWPEFPVVQLCSRSAELWIFRCHESRNGYEGLKSGTCGLFWPRLPVWDLLGLCDHL